MMEKRIQVFVSSTYADLRDERQAVTQALLELNCIPAEMELFPASDEEQWELIQRVIDDCDYYIVIVAGRYGSVDNSGVSYTEKEYDYACKTRKPVLGFLHRDPADLASKVSEETDEGRQKLDRFRDKVKKKMCRFWCSPGELAGEVSRTVVQQIKRKPAEGWVKARFASDPETILDLRTRITELEREAESSVPLESYRGSLSTRSELPLPTG